MPSRSRVARTDDRARGRERNDAHSRRAAIAVERALERQRAGVDGRRGRDRALDGRDVRERVVLVVGIGRAVGV